ncbi:MAG: carboxypeptidase-like regulatory domain-containing protein [Thermoanaerobaculia bacterium]
MPFTFLFAVWIHAILGQAQWRVVHHNNQITSGWGLPALAAESAAQPPARSIWLWSWRHAPVPVVPGSKADARPLAGDGPFWLEVQVVRPAHTDPSQAHIVAAPIEMWRELPESELPSWPVPANGHLAVPVDRRHTWRLRALTDGADGEGSWWADAQAGQRSVILRPMAARGIDLTVLQPDGKPAEKVHASIAEAAVRQGSSRTWALLADASGRLTAAGLPDEQEVALTLFEGDFPPLVLRGWPSRLPRLVTLSSGAEISGRITDRDRRAIAGATVEVETWIAQSARLLHLKDKSKADGSFTLRGLPAGQMTLSLRAPGYAPEVEPLELAAGERRELGGRVLEPGRALTVEVIDESGQPVPGAAIEAGAGLAATADAQGHATLAGLPLAPLELHGTAFGHQPGSQRLQPPLPAQALLVLRRAFVVRGRLLDATGVPVAGGTLKIEAATCSNEGVIRSDGRFEEDFLPGKDAQLVLRSPATRELRLTLAAGVAGEVRDLGDLTASGGPEVVGAVAGRQGEPLAGARIWLPRPGPQGPAMAWGAHDLVEATSDEDGRFRLSGLMPGPATLRIEATGYARAAIDVTLPDASADSSAAGAAPAIDVGTITLGGGTVVRVHLDPSRLGQVALEDAVARIDLRHQWLAADMLSAQVWNGVAEVPNVPQGAARMSVAVGQKVLCEQEVDVPGGGELDVDCAPGSLVVTGRVLVGGSAAGSGSLTWHSAEPEGWARIDTQVSPTGLRQQQVFGAGRPQVDVAVEADGTFQTRDLTPGPWLASFRPQQGSATPELSLQIPAGDHFDAVLPFAGLTVAGVVVTKEGSPAAGATVTEMTSGALAFARPDGTFSIVGLAPGKLALQARQDELASPVTAIELSAERPPDPVRLVVAQRDPPQVVVTVLDRSGSPVAGAMVFFEEEGKGMRLVVTATDGRAPAGIEAPLAPRVRAGAFAGGGFALGDWIGLDQARQGLAVQLGETGALVVRSTGGEGTARVVSPGGWDFSWLMRLLGASTNVTREQPLRLDGLPAGAYTVTLGASAATVSVDAGSLGEGTLE